MVYVDTSVLITLYIKEAYSRQASDWNRTNNEASPKTIFHELEFTNAIHLKLFGKERCLLDSLTIPSSMVSSPPISNVMGKL